MSRQDVMLLLGGGLFQLPLIEKVRSRGLRSVVLDRDPSAPGLQLGDEGIAIDVADTSAVLEAARRIRPKGVATIVSEISIRSAAAVAAELGVPGLDPDVALAATDKVRMRTAFKAFGLPTPRFAKVTSVEQAADLAATVGFPLVAKPVDSSGSRGVWRVEGFESLGHATASALENSRSRQAIIERYVDGPEFTIEAFAYEGSVAVHAVSIKKRVPFPQCVSIDLTYPPGLDEATETAIANAACSAVQALGIDNGPAHVEVILGQDGPVVVEVGARGGGYRIFSDIVPWVSGVDAVGAVVDLALGEPLRVEPTASRAAVLRFFNPAKEGVVRAVKHAEEARKVSGVLEVSIDAKAGSVFRGITRDGERPGYVIALCDTRAEAIAAADRVEELVHFEIDSNVNTDASTPGEQA